MTLFGIGIGTLAFFAFSFIAGLLITLQAVFGSKKETTRHRVVQGVIGAAYAVIVVIAFTQLEGVKSPYVDAGGVETGGQAADQEQVENA